MTGGAPRKAGGHTTPGRRGLLRLGAAAGAALLPPWAGARGQGTTATELVVSAREGRQVFQGHGYQVWLPALRPGAPVLGFLERMGARFVRMGMTAPLPEDAIRPGDSLEAMRRAARAAYERPSGAGGGGNTTPADRLRTAMPLLARQGIQTIAIIWDAPESLRADRVTGNARAKLLAPNAVEDYARLITAHLLEIQRISPDCLPAYVEAPNEPEGTWSLQIEAPAYAAFARSLRAQMDAAGLRRIGLVGPGNGSLRAARGYFTALRGGGPGATDPLAAWSTHVWDNRIDDAPPVVRIGRDIRDVISAVPKPLFITEYNADGDRWNERPFACGPRTEVRSRCTGPSADEDARYALNVAQQSLALIADGAAALVLWEAQDQGWGKRLGVLDPAGRPKPAAEALAALLTAIPRDSAVLLPRGRAPDGVELCGFLARDGHFVMAMAATGQGRGRWQVRLETPGQAQAAQADWRSYPANAVSGMEVSRTSGGLVLSFEPQVPDFVLSASLRRG